MTSTQTMKPSDEAKTVVPASVHPAAPSTIPTASTAIPPAMPAWPNQRVIFRARQAASDEPMIAVAAHADAGAAQFGRSQEQSHRLQREICGAAEHDDAREEAVGVEPDEPGAQAGDEPEVRERGSGEEGRGSMPVVRAEHERRQRQGDVEIPEDRQLGPCHAREATTS